MTIPVSIRRMNAKGAVVVTDDASGCFDILIGALDDARRIRISLRDGWVEVATDMRLEVKPIAGNAIRVRSEDGSPLSL